MVLGWWRDQIQGWLTSSGTPSNHDTHEDSIARATDHAGDRHDTCRASLTCDTCDRRDSSHTCDTSATRDTRDACDTSSTCDSCNTSAIKVIEKTHQNFSDLQELFREVNSMRMVNHPNIVKLLEVTDTPETLFIVMNSGGDLFTYLEVQGCLTEGEARGA
ncbi:unnamed protein product, partial [Rangifer tarandus platyrhynchus]